MEAFRDFVHDCSLMYMGIQRDSLTLLREGIEYKFVYFDSFII